MRSLRHLTRLLVVREINPAVLNMAVFEVNLVGTCPIGIPIDSGQLGPGDWGRGGTRPYQVKMLEISPTR